jgi:hypothetical protein
MTDRLRERMTSPRTTLRALAAVQTAGAAVLAVKPESATKLIGDDRRLSPPAWIVRVLGVRSAVQGAAQLAWPTPAFAWLGAAVDGTHAASMIFVAARSPRYRRAAMLSGGAALVTAALLAAVAAWESRRDQPPS